MFTYPVQPPFPGLGKGPVTAVDRLAAPILDKIETNLDQAVPGLGLGDAMHDIRRALGPQGDSMVLGAAVGFAVGGLRGAVDGAKIGSKF